MEKKLRFTRRGLDKLRGEIEELENRLKELQSQTAHVAEIGGDQWHDNASYDILVIDIRGVDRRLNDAHQQLNQAMIVDPPKNFDVVSIGTRVKIDRDNKEMIWEIVGFGESDPDRGLLAYNTPLASLIIGKKKGDTTETTIAGKTIKIKILEISKGGSEDVRSS